MPDDNHAAAEVGAEEHVVCVVGAGPYGASVLERLCANWSALGQAGHSLHIHVFDPYLEKGGRIWRNDQSPLLWMNTLPNTVGLFTDSSVRCEGPIRPGPTLWEWISTRRTSSLGNDALERERERIDAQDKWPSRALMGEYLRWLLCELAAHPPEGVRVSLVKASVVDVTVRSGAQHRAEQVWTDMSDTPVACDRVVFAQGNLDTLATTRLLGPADVSHPSAGSLVPAGYPAELDLGHIGPGEPTLLQGLGLAFFDLLQLLTVDRGGRFTRSGNGRLVYHPSGAEPALQVSSRRGVPLGPVPSYGFKTPTACPVPALLTTEALLTELDTSRWSLVRFERLLGHELELAYYSELARVEPHRLRMPWQEFRSAYLRAATGDPAPTSADRIAELIDCAVPDGAARFSPSHYRAPLDGRVFENSDDLQSWMRGYIGDSIRRLLNASESPHRAVVSTLRRLEQQLRDQIPQDFLTRNPLPVVSARSAVRARMRLLVGGPPWRRHEELLALSRAGVVTFLGIAGPMARAAEDAAGTCFTGECPSLAASHRVRHVVEARNPFAGISESADLLQRSLYARGDIVEGGSGANGTTRPGIPGRMRVNSALAVVDRSGDATGTRFAVGGNTSVLTHPGLPRVGTNSGFLRLTDQVARSVLRSLPQAEQRSA